MVCVVIGSHFQFQHAVLCGEVLAKGGRSSGCCTLTRSPHQQHTAGPRPGRRRLDSPLAQSLLSHGGDCRGTFHPLASWARS